MLKVIKANTKNFIEGYEPLDITIIDIDNDGNLILGSIGVNHNLMTNDEVLLCRVDGQRIDFRERVKVEKIIDDYTFTIKPLSQMSVSPVGCSLVDEHLLPIENSGDTVYVKLTFSEEHKHIFCVNRDQIENEGIKAFYYWDEETERYTNNGRIRNIPTDAIVTNRTVDSIACTQTNVIKKGDTIIIENINGELRTYTVKDVVQNTNNTTIYTNEDIDDTIPAGKMIYERIIGFDDNYFCEGDYVLYDGTFLKQIESGGTESEILNISDVMLYTSLNGGNQFLMGCIVPVNTNGYDNRYELLVPYEGNEWFVDNIDIYFSTLSLYCDDTRFWHGDDGLFTDGIIFKDGTTVNKITGDMEVDFSLGENFANDLIQRENFLEYAERVAGGSVNNIINYERYPYTPMYFNGKDVSYDTNNQETIDNYLFKNSYKLDQYLKPVKKINFKLNFRNKEYTTEDNYNYDYGSWKTDDAKYWNNFTISDDGKRLVVTDVAKTMDSKRSADLLGYLGFTDDDVFYQSDALKKSFLRLSFYDSPHRETQKLLFYSTIYFDTNELYRKYCDILSIKEKSGTEKKKMFVYDSSSNIANSFNLLDASLSCVDKFNDDASSDGFYLHLFDKMVSGNTCSMIYMKAEFNNAKYGKTVPLIMPTFTKDNAPIYATNEYGYFPKDYFYETSQTVNMGQLLNDMYIKVMLKFDYKTNNYVWFFPSKEYGEEITLTLFEPRITGYDAYSFNKEIGEDYGTEDGKPSWFPNNEGYIDNGVYYDENGDTEENSIYTDDCGVLFTTAVTLAGDSILQGTQLFNPNSMRTIKSIWIDGIKVKNELVSAVNGAKTCRFQLPDMDFTYIDNTLGYVTFTATTTTETWVTVFGQNTGEYTDEFRNTGTKEQKIHSVNYYFFPDRITKDNTEFYTELSEGIMSKDKTTRHRKTIECKPEVANSIKPNDVTSELTLPNGMFENRHSLRNVYFNGHGNQQRIMAVGNGAFNYCLGLLTVRCDENNGPIMIGKNVFAGSAALKEAHLDSVINIMREAFQGCYTLTNVSFNNDLKYVGCGAFGYTNIRKVDMSDMTDLVRLANSAFRRCYHMTFFGLPAQSNFTIGKQVFTNNAILKYVLKRQADRGVYKYNSNVTPQLMINLMNKGIKSIYFDFRNDRFKEVSLTVGSAIMKHYRNESYYNYLETKKPYVECFETWNNKN